LAIASSLHQPAGDNLLQLLLILSTRERGVIDLLIAKPLPTPAHKKTMCGAHLPQGRITINTILFLMI